MMDIACSKISNFPPASKFTNDKNYLHILETRPSNDASKVWIKFLPYLKKTMDIKNFLSVWPHGKMSIIFNGPFIKTERYLIKSS